MHAAESSPDGVRAEVPEGLAEVGRYPAFGDGCDHGLVILSMGLSYWLVESAGGYQLLVESGRAEEARYQLGLFDRESTNWPPRAARRDSGRVRAPLLTPAVWCLWVAAAFVGQLRWPGVLEEKGALDPVAVFGRGEWWRPLTALFLHANLVHLISNLAAGLLVFGGVLSTLGVGRGWFLLLAASIAGNLATAMLHRSAGYLSIGASTAVFAGIGMLAGHAVRAALDGTRGKLRARACFTPLAAGLILLGLLGAGDLRTDVVAHATGFLAGLVAGALASPRRVPS